MILILNYKKDIDKLSSEVLLNRKINNDLVATYLVDLETSGTWILTSKLWSTAILNGANKSHKRKDDCKNMVEVFYFIK